MTENEMYISTLEKMIPEIEECMSLFACDRSALQAALEALRQTAEYDNAREECNIYRKALETWGADAQTVMVFEEMAELQKELCKHARGKDNREAIAEEIADVLIMLEQMIILHDCTESVERFKDEKLKRLADRLKAYRKNGLTRQEAEASLQDERKVYPCRGHDCYDRGNFRTSCGGCPLYGVEKAALGGGEGG